MPVWRRVVFHRWTQPRVATPFNPESAVPNAGSSAVEASPKGRSVLLAVGAGPSGPVPRGRATGISDRAVLVKAVSPQRDTASARQAGVGGRGS